eukprot:comp6176_c0_seq1/m.2003 comp6176_c0_seq1/g.2003  ORF comp6176_c0_seq1/g.2003 comp6176_c0_seq1/m.2003 type:complete len:163 (-) comp6176_c0_seq1:340-828(-)
MLGKVRSAVFALFSVALFGQVQAQVSLSLVGIALRMAGNSFSSNCFRWFVGGSGPCPQCFQGFDANHPFWTVGAIKWGCMAQCLANVGLNASSYAGVCPVLGSQGQCVKKVVETARNAGVFNTSPPLSDPRCDKNVNLVNSVTAKLCEYARPYRGCGGLIVC